MKRTEDFTPTTTNQVRRAPALGHYDKETIYRILDASLIGHVGLLSAGRPVVIPMLFARHGDELLLHGSTKSRLMQTLCSGEPVCLAVTILDGLVLAKSLFHHSMNYRSVSVFGSGYEVSSESARCEALKIISDKVLPGRWEDARQPNQQEMKATCVAAIKIETASAKVRAGDPKDEAEDMQHPVWSGVVPITLQTQMPVGATDDPTNSDIPDYITAWQARFNCRT